MRLELGVLAEAATEKNGQLNILGTFDLLTAEQFPFVMPHLALAIKIRAHSTEIGKHSIRIVLRNSDGKVVQMPNGQPCELTAEGELGPSKIGAWADPSAQFVLNYQGLHIPKPGAYSFSIVVDGHHVGDVSFFVIDGRRAAQAA
ncbi:MAG: DUF6941 family protein [Longimicrobiales bacterium]